MDDLRNLQILAGIQLPSSTVTSDGSNISLTGNEKAEMMRQKNINPGTPEWFKLWFSKPYLTGEKPI